MKWLLDLISKTPDKRVTKKADALDDLLVRVNTITQAHGEKSLSLDELRTLIDSDTYVDDLIARTKETLGEDFEKADDKTLFDELLQSTGKAPVYGERAIAVELAFWKLRNKAYGESLDWYTDFWKEHNELGGPGAPQSSQKDNVKKKADVNIENLTVAEGASLTIKDTNRGTKMESKPPQEKVPVPQEPITEVIPVEVPPVPEDEMILPLAEEKDKVEKHAEVGKDWLESEEAGAMISLVERMQEKGADRNGAEAYLVDDKVPEEKREIVLDYVFGTFRSSQEDVYEKEADEKVILPYSQDVDIEERILDFIKTNKNRDSDAENIKYILDKLYDEKHGGEKVIHPADSVESTAAPKDEEKEDKPEEEIAVEEEVEEKEKPDSAKTELEKKEEEKRDVPISEKDKPADPKKPKDTKTREIRFNARTKKWEVVIKERSVRQFKDEQAAMGFLKQASLNNVSDDAIDTISSLLETGKLDIQDLVNSVTAELETYGDTDEYVIRQTVEDMVTDLAFTRLEGIYKEAGDSLPNYETGKEDYMNSLLDFIESEVHSQLSF